MASFDMDKTLRTILWVLVGLVLLSSFSAGWFFMAKEKIYNDYLTLEDIFKSSMERLNSELAASKSENTELRSRLEADEKEFDAMEARSADLESKYGQLLGERDDLNRELARTKKGRAFLEKRLKEAESRMFVAGLLKEKASLEVELKRLKDSVVPKDSRIKGLEEKKKDLDARVSRFEEEKDLLGQKLKDATEVAEVLSRDLLKEKDKYEGQRNESENIRVQNRALKSRISKLEEGSDRFKRLLAEKDNMQLRVAGLERDLQNKNQQIDKLKTAFERNNTEAGEFVAEAYQKPAEVDLPDIILQRDNRALGAGISTPSLERISESSSLEGSLKGRIVTINDEHDFVVIDLGAEDGIDAGARLKVYRDGLFFASLEVIQARQRIAACDIRDIKEGFWIKIDDIVVKR